MANKHKLKLIDGTFTPSEAGKVLFGLIGHKINYHQTELFSDEERFAKDVSRSKKRIEALKAVNIDLKKILSTTAEKDQKLQIKSMIEITIVNGK
jgi:hypothetical protein